MTLPNPDDLDLFADAVAAIYPPAAIPLRVLAGASALLNGREPTDAQRDAARQQRRLQASLTDAELDKLDAEQGVDAKPTPPPPPRG